MKDPTTEYYNQNSKDYIADTFNCDMSLRYKEFLAYLPKGKRLTILDLGFGSGRDSLFFLEQGHEVYSMDPSEEMIKHGEEIGLPHLIRGQAQDLHEKEAYDGIWACASLLHVPYEDLKEVFRRCRTALKPEGIMYASFKVGDYDGIRSGRHYTDMNIDRAEELIKDTGLVIKKCFYNDDVRPGRKDKWINLIMAKNSD